MNRLRLVVLPTVALALAAGALVGACASTPRGGGTPPNRVAPQEPWRATRPATAAATDAPLPTIQRADLKNGLTLLVIEDHALPTIDAALVVRAGAVADGRDAGLAALTWDLLDEGAGGLNAAGVANAFADIGTAVTTQADRERGLLRTRFLAKHADKAVELLALLAQKPAFAGADFDRLKKLHLDALREKQGAPDTIARQALAAATYGGDHPYGQPVDGTAASLEKLKPGAAKRFWADHAGPKAAALVLVGDVTLDEAKALAEKHFGRWKGAAKAAKAPASPKPRAGTQIVIVDFPGAPQTQIRVGRALIAAGDVDEPALTLMNEVLGGMFSSRLNLKLREEKQWTYGVSSSFDARLGPGPFVISTDVQTPHTVDALVEILAQLDGLRAAGVRDDELALARASYVKGLPALFALPPLQLDVAARLFALGQPLDRYTTLAAAVNATTADQVKKAAERALVREDLVVVLVGDRASIEAGLKDRNLGEVRVLGRDGAPLAGATRPGPP
jgi:zinc protease